MNTSLRLMVAATAFALATAAGAYGASYLPPHGAILGPADETRSAAQQRYADAPHGVDPMVTGPASEGFRRQQHMAGCAGADWPDIPLACYPARFAPPAGGTLPSQNTR